MTYSLIVLKVLVAGRSSKLNNNESDQYLDHFVTIGTVSNLSLVCPVGGA